MMPGYIAAGMLSQFGATVGKPCSEGSFFTLLPWYHYLDNVYIKDKNGVVTCDVKFEVLPATGSSDIPLVLLAIVDDLVKVSGIVAVGFVIWGGISYVTSQGNPDQIKRAHSTIINSLIGLGFCVVAISLISFIGARMG